MSSAYRKYKIKKSMKRSPSKLRMVINASDFSPEKESSGKELSGKEYLKMYRSGHYRLPKYIKSRSRKLTNADYRTAALSHLGLHDGLNITRDDILRAYAHCIYENPRNVIKCKMAFDMLLDKDYNLRFYHKV